MYRLTNSLDLTRGEDILTFGVTGSYYDVRHRFLPAAQGEYYFASTTDVGTSAPQRYQRGVLAEGQDPAVSFDVLSRRLRELAFLNKGLVIAIKY